MIWQMMVAMLHSNGQQRTEEWRQRKDIKNLLYSRKLLMMMTHTFVHHLAEHTNMAHMQDYANMQTGGTTEFN